MHGYGSLLDYTPAGVIYNWWTAPADPATTTPEILVHDDQTGQAMTQAQYEQVQAQRQEQPQPAPVRTETVTPQGLAQQGLVPQGGDPTALERPTRWPYVLGAVLFIGLVATGLTIGLTGRKRRSRRRRR